MTTIRQAHAADVDAVHRLLREAADWVDRLGVVMWNDDELNVETLRCEVLAGQFFVAEREGQIAGALRFQIEDLLFWPDIDQTASAFVHRLVVSRAFKGTGVSTQLLAWAVQHARGLGRTWLRLDCDDDRPKLKAFYERFGFRWHSHRQVGPYYVSRYEYRL